MLQPIGMASFELHSNTQNTLRSGMSVEVHISQLKPLKWDLALVSPCSKCKGEKSSIFLIWGFISLIRTESNEN